MGFLGGAAKIKHHSQVMPRIACEGATSGFCRTSCDVRTLHESDSARMKTEDAPWHDKVTIAEVAGPGV